MNAAQATTAAVDAVDATPSKKDESKKDEAEQNKEAAIQAVPQTIEASVQAACSTPPSVDEAVQAVDLQALQFSPAVAYMFFLRAGHAHDGRGGGGRVHQQREEERRQDLEDLQKMLDNIGKPKQENSQISFPR